MDNINRLIRNTQIDNEQSTASHNQNSVKDSDVIHIWDEVSSYIEKYMLQSKGISIPAFGTFSFIQKKIDIGNNKHILTQRPVFAISEKFAQTHGLKYTKYPVAGNIPVHPLNYSAISSETAYKREDIESCVRHVLLVFNRSVASKKNIEFTFTGIGKLQIRDFKVKMRFFKNFVNACDGSGKVVEEMQNRPNTVDSVMSRMETDRPHTRNTCVLPRIHSRAGVSGSLDNINLKQMETISEEMNAAEENVEKKKGENSSDEKLFAPVASLFSSEDKQQLSNSESEANVKPSTKCETPFCIPEPFPGPATFAANALKSLKSSSATNLLPRSETELNLQRPSSKLLLGSLPNRSAVSATPTSCGHHNAGQELCYLCHQRQKRNVPIYLTEERRQKEAEEQQVLQQYQQLKDMEKRLQEEAASNNRKDDRAKMDAFNLGVAEALKLRKLDRPRTSEPRSYVFRKRVRTPPKYIKQRDLSDALSKQIETNFLEGNRKKQEQDYLEKMEQMKLAEDLALQRQQFRKEKFERTAALKNALDFQVENKAIELPRGEQDTELFGKNDMTDEKLAEIKARERDTFLFHKDLVEQRKREDLLRQIKEQEHEAEILDRIKDELRMDRAQKVMRMMGMRKHLENEWMNSYHDKKLRDKDEKDHRMAPDGGLVHEQCDKYRRCAQCQRKVDNCGESNVWSDTRYVPGCRLMV